MQLKKLLQGSAFALVAAACAIAVPSVVKAAGEVTGTTDQTKVGTLAVDGEKAQLTVTGAGDNEVLVGFAKVNSKGKVTVATWDTYDGKAATVDLSKLSNTKVNYIAVTTPKALAEDAITIVKIPAVKKVFKVEYDPSATTDAIKVGEADKGKPSSMTALSKTDTDATAAAKYEYRTAYTGWATMKGASDVVDLSLYQEEGANLFVRKKGVKETSFPGTQASEGTYTFGANDKLKAYETTASLPGKEAKLVIKAKAKGPAVTGDYVKGTIKLPKNAEYRLLGTTLETTTTGKYHEVGNAAKTMTIDEITKDISAVAASDKTFDVEVRIAADTSKKKAASKWSRLNVTKPAEIESGVLTVGNKKATPAKPATYAPVDKDGGETYGGEGVAKTVIKPTASDNSGTSLVKFTYGKKGKLAQYQEENIIQIENNDDEHAYEIIVGAASATTAPTEGKVTKLAKGKGKKATLTGVADLSTIWVRVAGDKKGKTWVGKFTKVGEVDYTFKVPKKETQTP